MTLLKGNPGAVLSSCLVVIALLVAGCGSSGQAVTDDDETDEVSVGYGTQPREDLTSSVSSVDVDQEERPVTRVEEMFERVAGVRLIRAPGGGIRVLVRGINTIYGSTEPLYVIDGIPIQVDESQGLNWLNPSDIESIEVLKDASATAIYGSRGGNGVIIISTKRN